MGLIGKILKSVLEDEIRKITTEIYPNYTKESRQIAPPGIDANPLPDDQGFLEIIDGTQGKSVQIGIYNNNESNPGEIRVYGRDSDGTEKGETFYKNNGDIVIDTGSASIIIKENGNIDIVGGSSNMFFKTGGDIEINGNADNMVRFSELETGFNLLKTEVNAFVAAFNTQIITYSSHDHIYIPGLLAPIPTAPPAVSGVPGVTATADISASKIDEVLTS